MGEKMLEILFFFWPKHRNLYMKQEVGHLGTFSILFPISNYTIIDIFSPLLFSSWFISKILGLLYVQAVMRVMCSHLDGFVSFIWLAVKLHKLVVIPSYSIMTII